MINVFSFRCLFRKDLRKLLKMFIFVFVYEQQSIDFA